MASVLKAMENNLPGVLQAISKEQLGIAKTQADVDAAVSPIYAESQQRLYDTNGREMNRIGQEIETSNQRAASAREADIARTYGPELVTAADSLQRILDPEFYAGRAAVGKGITTLLGSMDPTKLSPTEVAELERATARSGATNPNATAATAANAMTFGRALQEKQARFGEAITQAAASLPQTRSGISGFEVGTRRALTPNTGEMRVLNTQSGTGQNAWQTGNNVLNQASNFQAIKAQKQTSILDDVLKGTQAFANVAGSFSFM